MGGHRVRNKEPMSWSDDNERTFIEILYEKVKSNALQCSTFTKDEWGRINETMIASTKMDYGIERLKGKWNRLRKIHRMFSELLGHTGVTWDSNTNTVNAAEEVWQHYYTISKSEYTLFRKEGCKHYHILGEIFSGTTATGRLGVASTQLPNTSEEERQMEDDFLNRGVHVSVGQNDEVHEISSTRRRDEIGTSGGSRRKEPKISKTDKLEACMSMWSENVSSRNEEAELRKLYLKEKLARIQGKSVVETENEVNSRNEEAELRKLLLKEKLAKIQAKTVVETANEVNNPDPFSTKSCMAILNCMDGLSDEVYMKAISAFKNFDFRVSFVEMPEARRGPILMLL